MGSNHYTPTAPARCLRGPGAGPGARGRHPAAEGSAFGPGIAIPAGARGIKRLREPEAAAREPGQLDGLLPAAAPGS